MGHRTRTNLAGLYLLFEIFHGYIHPEIAVEVDDYRIYAAHGVEHSAKAVVVAYLCGILFTLHAELLFCEAVAESLPVELRICHVMSVVVARSATELHRHLACLQLVELFCKTIYEHHDFLTKSCRRRRLTVCLCKHRYVLPLLGVGIELGDEFLYGRIIHVFERLLDGKRHAGVVDVLRSESEMDEFLIGIQSAYLVEFLLNEIFHSLDVMIGHSLDILYALCTRLVEVGVDASQPCEQRMIERCQLRQRELAQGYEILYFHAHSVADECIL